MTRDRDFKELVRARMRKTGESYAAARGQLVPPAAPPPAKGGTGMYPFERLTERAKRVLSLAQEEAERAHHNYIGTEHMLLGLLGDRQCLAAVILAKLGVEIAVVRQTLESVLGRGETIISRQIVPTSRVKRVIEKSFEEAQGMGQNYVATEHLLIGILTEGQGIAAHVLMDLGVTVERVRDELQQILVKGPASGEIATTGGPRSGGARMPLLGQEGHTVIGLATLAAVAEGAPAVTPDHMRLVLSDPGARALVEQAARIAAVQAASEASIARADYETAERHREELKQLKEEHEEAKAAWRKGLGRRRKRKSEGSEPG